MSEVRTALAQSLIVDPILILQTGRQNFACQEIGRLLGKKKCEELKKNMRNQGKRTKRKICGIIREKIVLFVCFLCKNAYNFQQKNMRLNLRV